MVWLVAHRGGAALEMENTKKAFDRALTYPIHGLECDLQLSKDDTPILFHDRSLYKFKLFNKRLKQFEWKEIQKFRPQSYRKWKVSGKDIMSYEEFLGYYRKQSKLFIELKSRKSDRVDGTSQKLLQAILKVHQKRKPTRETVFMSFDAALMKQVQKELPVYNHIQLAEDPDELSKKYLNEFYGVGLPLQKINPKIVNRLHARGLKVLVYTCNGPRQLAKVKLAKVDIVVSDKPDWISQSWGGLA